MNRRSSPLLAVLAVVSISLVATACTTTSPDSAARVGDVELQNATLEEIVSILPTASGTGSPSDPTDGNDVRQAIGVWTQAEALRQTLDERGIEIPDEARNEARSALEINIANFGELSDETREYLVDFVAGQDLLVAAGIDEAALAPVYNAGPTASGIACVSHILVETEEEAEQIVAELADGADFAELAAERSTDPGSAANGGSLGCSFTAEVSAQYVPEFAAAVLTAEVGVPTEPAQSDFGYHVVLLQPLDEVDPSIAQVVNSGRYLVSQADVHVNSRYGAFDPEVGIVALGR